MTTQITALAAGLTIIVAVSAGSANITTVQQSRTSWSGVYTPDQAKRGEAVYGESCSSCHGPDLSGGGFAPPLTGAIFNSAWNDLTLDDLSDRIRTTMPQDKPGALSRAQNTDVVTFILKQGGFPSGETELPSQRELLKQVTFKGTKP